MTLAHQGMGFTENDYPRFMESVGSVATEIDVGETEGGEVMLLLESLEIDIVTASIHSKFIKFWQITLKKDLL